jgi:hypothetical protein
MPCAIIFAVYDVGPAAAGLGARLFVPSMDQAQYTFAVQAGTWTRP